MIAFLNGVKEASDATRYEKYYTDFLRYQATMIKDFGEHIDSHAAKLDSLGVKTNITQYKKFETAKLLASDIPNGRWAAYISVWHHDIAIGGTWGTGGKLYIVEPNTGLLGYDNLANFLSDLDEYISKRRTKKGLAQTTQAGFWLYRPW